MKQLIDQMGPWLRWRFFPGCWIAWSGLKPGEELWMGNDEDQVTLPAKSEGILWMGVVGFAICRRKLQAGPLEIFYRRDSELYSVRIDFVPGRKYHCDLDQLCVMCEGNTVNFGFVRVV